MRDRDDERRARLSLLLQRQQRRLRAPTVVEAWRERGFDATALSDKSCENLLSWLRTHWQAPQVKVNDIRTQVTTVTAEVDQVLIMDLWSWDEAVGVIVPAGDLSQSGSELREIYPDGFLIVNPNLSRGLVVDFDDLDGISISIIEPDV